MGSEGPKKNGEGEDERFDSVETWTGVVCLQRMEVTAVREET